MLSQYSLIASGFIALSLTGCAKTLSPQSSKPIYEDLPSPTLPTLTPSQQPSTTEQILYVDSQRGTDTANAGQTRKRPLRTISYALQQAQPDTTIQLVPGEYTKSRGKLREKFVAILLSKPVRVWQLVIPAHLW